MGCLKNFLRAIIITLAVVGFMAIGGKDLVGGYLNNVFNPSKDEMLERAKKVGDFSHINDEFELEKATGILGSKQILTADDIKSDNVEEKLYKAVSKIKYQAISVDDLKVTKHGIMHSYGKEVPYVKFEARVKKLPIGDVGGIVSVAQTKDGKQRLLISANEKNKYSQLISDEFFKKIK